MKSVILESYVVNEHHEPYGTEQIIKNCLFKNRFLTVYSFTIKAKAWMDLSGNKRYVALNVDELKPGDLRNGRLIPFLEVTGKQVHLPFIFHQPQGFAKIVASQNGSQLFISIKGHFVLNIHTVFTFKIVVITGKTPARYDNFDWQNYRHVKKSFKLGN